LNKYFEQCIPIVFPSFGVSVFPGGGLLMGTVSFLQFGDKHALAEKKEQNSKVMKIGTEQ